MHFTVVPGFDVITDPRLACLRLHGRDQEAYLKSRTVAERFHYDCSDQELDDVVACANELVGRADEVHVVFNNNDLEVAPRAAQRMEKNFTKFCKKPSAEKGSKHAIRLPVLRVRADRQDQFLMRL